MPENAAIANIITHHQAVDMEGSNSIDDVLPHSQAASKFYDDDGRVKRIGTKFI